MRLLILFVLFLASFARADDRDDRLAKLEEIASQTTGAGASSAVSRGYEELGFSESIDRLAELGEDDVDLAFEAAQAAFFYTSSAKHLSHIEAAYAELVARRSVDADHTRLMASAFLQARHFRRARQLGGAGTRIPDSVDELGPGYTLPTFWQFEGNVLTRRRIDMQRVSVLVVANPLCHFSNDAWNALAQDEDLAGILSKHAVWILPQSGTVPFEALEQWNASNPSVPISLVHQEAEWPFIDSWATPTFYFLQSGKVAAKVVGWPAEGNRNGLLEAAVRIGLLDGERRRRQETLD